MANFFILMAASGIRIPEPGEAALFLIGVAGLLIGHRVGRSRGETPDDDENA